jgi:lipooligosaccharide transport system permease protein
VLLPVAMLLTANMFALIGLTFTASIRNINYYGFYYTLWLTPLFLFSGIFFPLDNPHMAGGHAETIAWFTPLYHCVELMRGLAQGPLTWVHALHALWILAVSAALSMIVPRRMRKRMIQ